MTVQVKQWICIKFCVKLEHSSAETIQMIQKAAAMGNGWLAASSTITCSLMHYVSCRVFWWNIKSPRLLIPRYSPDLVPFDFWPFPKLKSPLKWQRFQIISEIQENMMGQLMAIGRIVWSPNMPTLKGTKVSLSYVPCFLCLVFSSINVSIFHYMAGCFLDRPHISCI